VQLKVSMGDRHLGPYVVSNTNDIVASFAEVAVKVLQNILSHESTSDDHSNMAEGQGHTQQAPSQLASGELSNETVSEEAPCKTVFKDFPVAKVAC
jgi:hypothetical protein